MRNVTERRPMGLAIIMLSHILGLILSTKGLVERGHLISVLVLLMILDSIALIGIFIYRNFGRIVSLSITGLLVFLFGKASIFGLYYKLWSGVQISPDTYLAWARTQLFLAFFIWRFIYLTRRDTRILFVRSSVKKSAV